MISACKAKRIIFCFEAVSFPVLIVLRKQTLFLNVCVSHFYAYNAKYGSNTLSETYLTENDSNLTFEIPL